jgi:aminoglycoside/choline kinase family phosphotransferase
MPSTDDPIRLAEAWLQARGVAHASIEPHPGDVSARRYARLASTSGETTVLALYPPALVEAGDRFARSSAVLSAAGVRVPRLLEWDPDGGIMWLEDVGDRSLYDMARAGAAVDAERRRALDLLAKVTALDARSVAELNPPLDAPLLRRELDQSWRLVLAPRELTGEGAVSETLRRALGLLCDALGAASPRPCHRDFMARNLMLTEDGEIVVLDHQDLRLGPPWYDVASLLNDSVYASEAEERALLDHARVPRSEREDYHRAAAQRALKIVGTFAAFAEQGATRHLPLVGPSLRCARRHLLRLPETAEILRRLAPAWDRQLGRDARPSDDGALC